jgi:hypothetical protein
MSEREDGGAPAGFLTGLFARGAEWLKNRAPSRPNRRHVTLRSGQTLEVDVLEQTSFTVVVRAADGVVTRIPREDVARIGKPGEASAAMSATSGAPGDEGTVTFGKKGPREYGKGDIQRDAERREAELAAARSPDSMTPLRARIFAAFLNPAPNPKARGRDLVDRAQQVEAITDAVLESEGVDVASVSALARAAKREEVRAEANAMKAARLLMHVKPPDEHKIWEASPDTYALTSDGASLALAVYEAATAARP